MCNAICHTTMYTFCWFCCSYVYPKVVRVFSHFWNRDRVILIFSLLILVGFLSVFNFTFSKFLNRIFQLDFPTYIKVQVIRLKDFKFLPLEIHDRKNWLNYLVYETISVINVEIELKNLELAEIEENFKHLYPNSSLFVI